MENKKKLRLQVRLTEEQDKLISRNAKKEGKEKSTYVIECCTKKNELSSDETKTRSMLGIMVEMQDTLNQIETEHGISDITLNQMKQGVNQLWQLLK